MCKARIAFGHIAQIVMQRERILHRILLILQVAHGVLCHSSCHVRSPSTKNRLAEWSVSICHILSHLNECKERFMRQTQEVHDTSGIFQTALEASGACKKSCQSNLRLLHDAKVTQEAL